MVRNIALGIFLWLLQNHQINEWGCLCNLGKGGGRVVCALTSHGKQAFSEYEWGSEVREGCLTFFSLFRYGDICILYSFAEVFISPVDVVVQGLPHREIA